MAKSSTLENRIARLENEFAALKNQLRRNPKKKNWIQNIAGTFKDVPEFDEIVRLGKEFRQSQKKP